VRDTSAYQVDGVRVPSVTEILKLAGFNGYDRVSPQVLEKARQRGADIHSWLELLDLGHLKEEDIATADPAIQAYLMAWVCFKSDTNFVQVHIEKPVVNELYRYGGTPDREGCMGEAPTAVFEIKATATLLPTAGVQLAAYANCWSPMIDRYSVLLRPDGTYRLKKHTGLEDLHDFLAAVRVAHFKLRHGIAKLEG